MPTRSPGDRNMVEKVTVPCPVCRAKLRMPLYVRPGKKPKCPRCHSIVRPEQVLTPENLPTEKMMDAIPDFAPPDELLDDSAEVPAAPPPFTPPPPPPRVPPPAPVSASPPPPPRVPPPPPPPARPAHTGPLPNMDETFIPLPGRPSPFLPPPLEPTDLPSTFVPRPDRPTPVQPPSAADIPSTVVPPADGRPTGHWVNQIRATEPPNNELQGTGFEVPLPPRSPASANDILAQLPDVTDSSEELMSLVPPAAVPPRADPTVLDWAAHGKKLPVVPGYEIVAPLGKGATGTVYRARQAGSQREVALKLMTDVRYADPAARAKFRVDAEAAVRLRHPGLAQVFSYGEWEGRPFLVMELLPGGRLDQRADRPDTPAAAAELVAAAAEAVGHAHAAGVTHRGLYPGRLLLAADGRPKVSGFGLPRPADSPYSPPEQAVGRVGQVGPPADVFALGAVLFELLAGRPPAVGEVSPRKAAGGVSKDLDAVVRTALAAAPADRYRDGGELAADLWRWRRGERVSVRPAFDPKAWLRRYRMPLLAAAGGLLLAATAVGVWQAVSWLTAEPPTQPAPPPDPQPGDVPMPPLPVPAADPGM